jgi:hypothetical protein
LAGISAPWPPKVRPRSAPGVRVTAVLNLRRFWPELPDLPAAARSLFTS